MGDFSNGLIAYAGQQWGNSYENRVAFARLYLKAAGLADNDFEVKGLLLDAEINTLGCFCGVMANFYDSHIPLLRGAPHPTSATKQLPFGPSSAGCQTSDTPTANEVIDLLAAAAAQIRGSTKLVEAVIHVGIIPTLPARSAGSENLWKFLDDLQERNMLRLFGIAPKPKK